MTHAEKERRLNDAFATLTHTLVHDCDFIELLQTVVEICKDITGAAEVGLLLADDGNRLEVVTSTRENGDLVETMQRGADAGPCHQCYLTGEVVSDPHIADSPPEWAEFRDAALALGLESVVAMPMRFRETTIGVLSLYGDHTTHPDDRDLRAAQTLADAATISILHERVLHDTDLLQQQLSLTLRARVVIEQAKGVLAQLHGIHPEDAFIELREYARTHKQNVNDVAAQLVDRTLTF
ncbi:GAF and ANTAR domain-containing protein [Herbiconiux sp. VKM Ac-2851]|uniref:GAF and ANTAR domain-containing protein n=1 Tax=Herbiconiux sp. VKM Ac-2851 TaxID=2739025 RepID=UPI0015641589|nr:GAF and ANTAR domain-containing protein [Herbiconiux sp. VKM Ac-2851]NQX37062.1 GAF and ANTAR domain-containing protein [Herbiconiux sp. VKM Ac-2851]